MEASTSTEKFTKEVNGAVLRAGDWVHIALSKPVDHAVARLSLKELQAAICQIGERVTVTFPQGIFSGDVFSGCTNTPFVTLQSGLLNALQADTGALLRIMEYTIALRKLSDGCFALFDPHARNERGFVDGDRCAVVMKFPSIFCCKLHQVCATKGL